MVEHVHGNRGDHGRLPVVVLEDEDHVKVLQLKLDALKVDQLNVLQRDDEGRLQGEDKRSISSTKNFFKTYPVSEIHQAATGGLQEDIGAVGHAEEGQVAKRRVKLHRLVGHLLHLVAEELEGGLQLLPHLPLRLLRGEVIAVVHVLVLAQVGGDLADLSVELHVRLLLLPKHDRVLVEKEKVILKILNHKTLSPHVP